MLTASVLCSTLALLDQVRSSCLLVRLPLQYRSVDKLSNLALLDQVKSLCLLVKPPHQYWSSFRLDQSKHCRVVRPRKRSYR